MKITRIFLVFLILASLYLAGCTDRKAKSSDPSADLPKPTLSPGTPETSQPGTEASPTPETDPRTPETSRADTSASSDPPESTADRETAAATAPDASDADPVEVVSTEDATGGIPVEENPTIYASGDVELIGGD